LQRFDVIFVAGLRSAVEKAAAMLGRVARPSTATDLLTLSVGMILGLLIGGINVPVAGFKVGLGNAGGLLLSGIFVSSAFRACASSAARLTRHETSSKTSALSLTKAPPTTTSCSGAPRKTTTRR
jgi:hypothetical protein